MASKRANSDIFPGDGIQAVTCGCGVAQLGQILHNGIIEVDVARLKGCQDSEELGATADAIDGILIHCVDPQSGVVGGEVVVKEEVILVD